MRLDNIDTIVGSLVTIVARAYFIIQIETQSSLWTVIPLHFYSDYEAWHDNLCDFDSTTGS